MLNRKNNKQTNRQQTSIPISKTLAAPTNNNSTTMMGNERKISSASEPDVGSGFGGMQYTSVCNPSFWVWSSNKVQLPEQLDAIHIFVHSLGAIYIAQA